MKSLHRWVLGACLFALLAPAPSLAGAQGNWEVYFSPRGGCTAALVKTLAGATKSILVQAYSFTSMPIGQALVDAHKRNVSVKVLLDRSDVELAASTGGHPIAEMLFKAGVPTWVDTAHAIAHNKVMVIDGRIVVTGSFNFTANAEERNAENLLIMKDADLAEAYTQNWEKHLSHSSPYDGPSARPVRRPQTSPDPESGFYGIKNGTDFRLIRTRPQR